MSIYIKMYFYTAQICMFPNNMLLIFVMSSHAVKDYGGREVKQTSDLCWEGKWKSTRSQQANEGRGSHGTENQSLRTRTGQIQPSYKRVAHNLRNSLSLREWDRSRLPQQKVDRKIVVVCEEVLPGKSTEIKVTPESWAHNARDRTGKCPSLVCI